jgi:hypothetical protein
MRVVKITLLNNTEKSTQIPHARSHRQNSGPEIDQRLSFRVRKCEDRLSGGEHFNDKLFRPAFARRERNKQRIRKSAHESVPRARQGNRGPPDSVVER